MTLTVANSCTVDVWSGQVFVCEPAHDADFTWSPPTPVEGGTVTFASTVAGNGPFTFEWDFGDGGTGSGQTASHLYAELGVYTVEMTVSKACSTFTVQYEVTLSQSMLYTYLPMTTKE